MAQTYEIDINRYNGTDYDTLLPTPATHAATHKADGTDPLVCQTGNYGDSTVTTAKIANNAVTMAKISVGATHTDVVITLSATAWSNNLQTVNVTGVTTSNLVIVAPSPDNATPYGEAGVICLSQASGTLTFKCDSTPSQDLVVNITMPR